MVQAQVNPNIHDASYTRPDARGQSAARLVRYLIRRPANKDRPGPESAWHTIPEEHVFGDAERFKSAANSRRRERLHRHRQNGTDIGQDHSPKNVAYEHVVISPKSREAFRPEDFEALIDPWVRDRRGKPCAYFAAIHYDDPEGPKLHLAIARDRIHKTKELPLYKDRTDALIEEREALLEQAMYPEQVREHQRGHDHEAHREETPIMEDRQREEEIRRQAREEGEAFRGPDDAENQARRERTAENLGWSADRLREFEDAMHERNVETRTQAKMAAEEDGGHRERVGREEAQPEEEAAREEEERQVEERRREREAREAAELEEEQEM